MGRIDVSGDSFFKKYCLSAMSATVAESGKCYFVFFAVRFKFCGRFRFSVEMSDDNLASSFKI